MLLYALLATILANALAENLAVTCGSTLKLQHVKTGARLHSHEVAYARGSQQQSVTGFPSGEDSQSYWVVKGPKDKPCTPGTTIKKGDPIRMLHSTTRKWLHSHKFYSPLSNQQEVSAFGSDEQTDGGDNWSVEWDSTAEIWKQGVKIRLRHTDTNTYLMCNDIKFSNPIAGQLEVCSVPQKGKGVEWQAAEGVYLPDVNAPEPEVADEEESKDGKDEL